MSSNMQKKYDVVGPICESSDTFAQNYSLPVLQRGDLLAIRSVEPWASNKANTT